MTDMSSLFAAIRRSHFGRFAFRPLTCMCFAWGDFSGGWRPCPPPLCEYAALYPPKGRDFVTSGGRTPIPLRSRRR